MNLLTAVQSLEASVFAAVLAAIPILVRALLAKWGLDKNDKLVAQLDGVLEEAAGLAYKRIAAGIAQGGLDNVQIHNKALADALQYAIDELPSAMIQLGISPDQVSKKIEAKLGKILGVDPSVSVKIPVPAQTVTPGSV